MIEEQFCAEITRLAGDPLAGTATQVGIWVLLQYDRPWRAKATADNDLLPTTQALLDAQLAAIPGSRLQFISQEAKTDDDGLKLFVAISTGPSPRLYEFELSDYEALHDLDLAGLVAAGDTFEPYRRHDPLFLVCTNGKRDKCCARFGRPVYDALRRQEGAAAWRTTHLGGHRYAPTVLFLPHGLIYGLLEEEAALDAASAYSSGRLSNLPAYRGRSSYPPEVQAAETFLRQETGIMELDGVSFLQTENVGADRWLVHMQTTSSNDRRPIPVRRSMSSAAMLVSCNEGKMKPVVRFEPDEPSPESAAATG